MQSKKTDSKKFLKDIKKLKNPYYKKILLKI